MSKAPILLILGGTSGGRTLAYEVADAGIDALYSYAGRTASPESLPIPTRIGGFGGIAAMADYIAQAGITHVVDATHPFADTISRNAIEACRLAGVPLIALVRPPWKPEDGDTWIDAPDMDHAVAALKIDPLRVFLAIGRTEIDRFEECPQHHYLLRLVDPPAAPPPFPSYEIVVGKGPFDLEGDIELLKSHRIDLVVSKNSGGSGARAKIDAARALDIPVLMIERPTLPGRPETSSPDEVLDWVLHSGSDRGV